MFVLLEVPLEVDGSKVIACYFQIGKPDTTQHQLRSSGQTEGLFQVCKKCRLELCLLLALLVLLTDRVWHHTNTTGHCLKYHQWYEYDWLRNIVLLCFFFTQVSSYLLSTRHHISSFLKKM